MPADANEQTASAPPAEPADAPVTPKPRNPAETASVASCLTGLILALLVIGTLLYVWLWDSSLIPAGMSWGPWRILLLVVLVIVIPVVVFRAVTLWIMGEGPRFADVEFSWRAGVEAMAAQGITLKSAPLFLIVGAGSDKLRKNLMAASGLPFRVNGIPDAPAPLHWYATDDAIYLYLEDVSWTNLAGKLYRKSLGSRRGRRRGPSDQPSAPTAPAAAAPAQPTPAPAQPYMATLAPGQAGQPQTEAAGGALAGPVPGDPNAPSMLDASARVPAVGRSTPPGAYLGTLDPNAGAGVAQPAAIPAAPQPTRPPAAPKIGRQRQVMSQDSSLQLRRLESVCAKLRRFREPVCAANGILVLLPFDLLQAGRSDIEEVERALTADLATAQNELQVRCPVTALVVAMEQERGFCELIRRIGRQQAAQQRFGQRFDLRRKPTIEELQRFNSYVCGVFEDWVYTLFRDESVLSHAGNPALYNLLCKVRRSFQARLSDVLSKGFGCQESATEPLLFSGCYFAATGSQPERQAFVRGVLQKLSDEQEELAWTSEAEQSSVQRRVLTRLGWGLAALFLVILIALFANG